MKIIKFNFRAASNTERRRLFVPINTFTFAAFLVPIRFRQPVAAEVSVFSVRRGGSIYGGARSRLGADRFSAQIAERY